MAVNSVPYFAKDVWTIFAGYIEPEQTAQLLQEATPKDRAAIIASISQSQFQPLQRLWNSEKTNATSESRKAFLRAHDQGIYHSPQIAVLFKEIVAGIGNDFQERLNYIVSRIQASPTLTQVRNYEGAISAYFTEYVRDYLGIINFAPLVWHVEEYFIRPLFGYRDPYLTNPEVMAQLYEAAFIGVFKDHDGIINIQERDIKTLCACIRGLARVKREIKFRIGHYTYNDIAAIQRSLPDRVKVSVDARGFDFTPCHWTGILTMIVAVGVGLATMGAIGFGFYLLYQKSVLTFKGLFLAGWLLMIPLIILMLSILTSMGMAFIPIGIGAGIQYLLTLYRFRQINNHNRAIPDPPPAAARAP